MNCLAYRANRICSPETLTEELTYIKDILKRNGYPEAFVRRNMESKPTDAKVQLTRKKKVFANVSFKEDKELEILEYPLSKAIS
ncbi:unnamed protein product [Echinostoma caproni]|uniref:DNA-directed DNA polymerase n=1 Tax=Echinostoma caproni TaxID=27848 RepID=A0A183B6I7_9TREM|nr:unnamed protein product [Echinostoma caproni]